MIGVVVGTWISSIENLYGEQVLAQSMEAVGWERDKLFSPLESVEDAKLQDFMDQVTKYSHKDLSKVWNEIGGHNLNVFIERYPLFFTQKNLYNFLCTLDAIHNTISERMPGSSPPRITIEQSGTRSAILTYRSSRGMFDYMMGLLLSAADYYGEMIQTQVLDKTADSMILEITFERDLYEYKKYWFNTLMSFGFIRSLKIKIMMTIFIIMFLTNYIFTLFHIPYKIVEEIISAVVSGGLVVFLLSPMKDIQSQVDSIIKEDTTRDREMEISSKDFFEDISKNIIGIMRHNRENNVSFKGVTDEVVTFTSQFESKLKGTLGLFESITNSVDGVLDGVRKQKNETESIEAVLRENMTSLEQVIEKEEEAFSNLSSSVKELDLSQNKIEEGSKQIQKVTEAFEGVNALGLQLKEDIVGILDIADAVTGIAEQTNLLSLNASIEAARAGDAGKGFAIVALEVQELSEDSKAEAQKIAELLEKFTDRINQLTENINDKFTVLSNQNKTLEENVTFSKAVSSQINDASEVISQVAVDISKQLRNIETLFSSVENMTTVGQENARMANNVKSDIDIFDNKIYEIINVLGELSKITSDLAEEIKRKGQ